jgi:hypothetical protein
MGCDVRAADLRPYESFVRTLRATTAMQLVLGLDHEDVQSEARAQALIALRRFRELGRDPSEEKAYTRESIRNAMRSIARRATARARNPDDLAWGSIQTQGLPLWETAESASRSVEDAYLDRERRAQHRAACARLRAGLDPDKLRLLIQRHAEGVPLAQLAGSAKTAFSRVRRAEQEARRILDSETLCAVEHLSPETPPMPIPPEDVDTENLIRVALINGHTPSAYDRDEAIQIAKNINGETQFPVCFADEYDEQDDCCQPDSCGFAKECSACVGGKWTMPEVEDALVTLRNGQAVAAPEKTPERLEKASAPTPTPEVLEPEIQAEEPTEAMAEVIEMPRPPAPPEAVTEKPVAEMSDAEFEASAREAVPVEDPPPTKKKAPPKRKKKAAKPRTEETPPKPPKKTAKKTRGPVDATTPEGYVPLSNRKGVPRGKDGGYRLKKNGQRWVRIPQGSAVAVAMLPVGTRLTRHYQGKAYVAEKVEDGRFTKSKDGSKRKRDGKWKLVEVWTLNKDGERVKKLKRVLKEATSLNNLTFLIVGGRGWSGARFWGVTFERAAQLVPEVAEQIKNAPTSMYDYGD